MYSLCAFTTKLICKFSHAFPNKRKKEEDKKHKKGNFCGRYSSNVWIEEHPLLIFYLFPNAVSNDF